jgi:catechol 2,3-dioxygenase
MKPHPTTSGRDGPAPRPFVALGDFPMGAITADPARYALVVAIDAAAHPGAVALRVTDLDRARDFYADALGLQPLAEEDGVARMSADGERGLVALDARDTAGGAPSPLRATGLFHLALLYPSRATLGQAVQRALDHGAGLDGASDHLVSEAIYLHDPDANGIEIYRDRPREEWPPPPPGQAVAMDSLPLDVAALLAEAAAPDGGADPGTVMGHVHLKVSDLDRSVAFYRDALGLDLQAQLGPQAAFLAAGGYHHHIGLNVWHSQGAGPPPPGSAGLAWFELELSSPEAVAAAVDGLRAAGAEVSESEDALSVRDPDGIQVRLRAA